MKKINILGYLSIIQFFCRFLCCEPARPVIINRPSKKSIVKVESLIKGGDDQSAEIDEINRKVNKMKHVVDLGKLVTQNLEGKIMEVESDLVDFREEQNSINKVLEKRLGEHDAKFLLFEGKIEKVEKELQKADGNMSLVRENLKSIDEKYAKEVQEFNKKNKGFEGAIKKAHTKEDYDKAMAAWKKAYDAELKKLEDKANDIDADSKKSIATMAKLVGETKVDLEKKIKEIKKGNKDTEQWVKKLNEKTTESIEKLKDEHAAEIAKVQKDAQVKIEALETKNKTLDDAVKDMANKVNTISATLTKKINDAEELTKKLQAVASDGRRRVKEGAVQGFARFNLMAYCVKTDKSADLQTAAVEIFNLDSKKDVDANLTDKYTQIASLAKADNYDKKEAWIFGKKSDKENMQLFVQEFCKDIKKNYKSYIIGYENDLDKDKNEKEFANKLIQKLLIDSKQSNLVGSNDYKIT